MVLFLGCLPALHADERDKFVGAWKTKAKFAGFDQLVTVANDGGQWSIKGAFEKDGAVAGTFIGENIRFEGGLLTYRSKLVKRPAASWQDNDTTLRIDGDALTMSFTAKNGEKIVRMFERMPGGPKAAANTPPKSEASKFAGTWKGRIDTHDEIWTIKYSDGTWSVNGKFRRNGAITGSFIGTDIKEVDDTLTFTRKFVKKPNSEWRDEAKIVVKNEGENLSYTWKAGPFDGKRALEKYVEDEKPKNDELGKFRGYWTADMSNGFRVVLLITMKNEQIQVSGNCYDKKNQFAGNFIGIDAALKDGFLTFSQKFIKKPVSSWSDGKIHTLQILSDNVLKFSWKGPFGSGTENFARLIPK